MLAFKFFIKGSQQYFDLSTDTLYLFNNVMICALDLALIINLMRLLVDII